jgi:hypothetical protein
MATFDSEDFAHNKSISHNSSGLGQDSTEGLTRDVHHLSGRLLIEPLEIT